MSKLNNISDLNAIRKRLRSRRDSIRTVITICGGTGCQASRSQDVIDAVKKELKKQKLGRKVVVRVTGCHGFCEQGPIMVLEPG
ncbi:MAG: (2Fe-2S) ferredoxin domain-containing protein, partial [Deltaproteobacteria bacterium]|nr:(2Fe-2S) ferredoxin domain-containing protein [Deltaproteobacteria bacterium]